LKEENIEPKRLVDACKRIYQIDENYITCINYVLASTEFEEFYEMMVDYKKIFAYEFQENTELNDIINK
jgi:hypothetical protein